MTFRVGQKVVCVDDGPHRSGWNPHGDAPIKNKVYTVVGVETYRGLVGIHLREIRNGSHNGLYKAMRFRPAVERKTDISVFTEILRTTKAPVNADARCFVGSHEEKSHG